MKFTKMSALGNDFIMVDGNTYSVEEVLPHVSFLCDRRFGIGGDGVIMILPPTEGGHYKMRIFNSDGSEAEMCGNGIRCFALYVEDKFGSNEAELLVETMCGIKRITSDEMGYRVDMGAPILKSSEVPVVSDSEIAQNEIITVNSRTYTFTAVSMGNPHAIIHTDSVTDEQVLSDGPLIETDKIFPEKTNVEFIRVINATEIEMRVWERGCGETLACGTGACASVVAGILNRKHDKSVTVHLRGGDLKIEWAGNGEDSVFMTGPASLVFEGEIEL